MGEQATPRSMVKALLRGEQQGRTLLLPLIFSLGARLENLPLATFVANPTKIANALRQIRGTLKVDGLACYFDPFLEVEALGGKLEWTASGAMLVSRPPLQKPHDLQQQLGSAEQVLNKGRVPVAFEVLKRLKIMLQDEPALMIGVTGPLTLAAQLWDTPGKTLAPRDAVEFASEITASLSRHFLEAGADVVFVFENSSLPENPQDCEWWAGLLDPVINVIRFYEALPVLMLSSSGLSPTATQWIAERNWECAVCSGSEPSHAGTNPSAAYRAISLPANFFHEDAFGELSLQTVRQSTAQCDPVFLTSATDMPPNADIKTLATVLRNFRGAFRTGS